MAALRSALRSLRPAATRLATRTPATRRSMGGMSEVKRNPDLERWNNVRDNVDQLYDITDPKQFVGTMIFAVVIPVCIYKLIASEGMIPNGDPSTGVKFGPNSDKVAKPQGSSLPTN